MKSVQNKDAPEARCQGADADFVYNDTRFIRDGSVKQSELFKSEFCQVGGNSRVRPRRFTRSNQRAQSNFETLNFAGVKIPRMVATRGGSSPRIDIFSIHQNRHAIACFNFRDMSPADGVFEKWIGNFNSFIKEFDSRMDEKQVSKRAKETSPCDCNERVVYISIQDDLANNPNSGKENSAGNPVARFWTEEFRIVHLAMLSWARASTPTAVKRA